MYDLPEVTDLKLVENEIGIESWPPPLDSLHISNDELIHARLAPDCIVENMFYSNLAQLVAAGGTGKTTLFIYIAVHIILGKPLFGNAIKKSGSVLFLTAEDSREMCLGRLRKIMDALKLSEKQRDKVMTGFLILDTVGEDRKLVFSDGGNVCMTKTADQIINVCSNNNIAMIAFDPLIAFGASESFVNDNEQAIATACRRIIRQLNVCVLLIHHTGQAAARSKTKDAYAGRGGTALPDAARMVLNLHPWEKGDKGSKPPNTLTIHPDNSVLVLSQPKLSYAAPPPTIWLARDGFNFEWAKETSLTQNPEVEARARADQLERFLLSELNNEKRYTKTQLIEGTLAKLDMTRNEFNQALTELEVNHRLIDKELPKEERKGGRQTYLYPTEFIKTDGGVN